MLGRKCDVLVVIVTYNGKKWMNRCLSSVQASHVKCDVLLIDNKSSDGTLEYVRANFPEIQIYPNAENLGFGKANNIGLKYAKTNKYPYVYLLNQDAWIFPDTLSVMIETHEKNQGYGILSPIQLQANKAHFDVNFVSGVCSWNSNKCLFEDVFFGRIRDVYEVNHVMAAHWLISCDCLCEVGGFSPTFPHYGEDYNYIGRCKYKGYKVGIVPKAFAVHDREYRNLSEEQTAYRDYVFLLQTLSEVFHPVSNQYWFLFYYTLKQSIKNKSLKAFSYLFRIMKEKKQINEKKKESLEVSAFL